MKTSEERDAMVQRVQVAYEKWPTLDQMPDDAKLSDDASAIAVDVDVTPNVQNSYINALYELSHKGASQLAASKVRPSSSVNCSRPHNLS